MLQESEVVSDINRTLNSFSLDEKPSGGGFSLYDPLEEPTRDPDVWPPPPPRLQPVNSIVASSRPVASRRVAKEGPRNAGAQIINKGPNKPATSKFRSEVIFLWVSLFLHHFYLNRILDYIFFIIL